MRNSIRIHCWKIDERAFYILYIYKLATSFCEFFNQVMQNLKNVCSYIIVLRNTCSHIVVENVYNIYWFIYNVLKRIIFTQSLRDYIQENLMNKSKKMWKNFKNNLKLVLCPYSYVMIILVKTKLVYIKRTKGYIKVILYYI